MGGETNKRKPDRLAQKPNKIIKTKIKLLIITITARFKLPSTVMD
jgi:hypothetical protein